MLCSVYVMDVIPDVTNRHTRVWSELSLARDFHAGGGGLVVKGPFSVNVRQNRKFRPE